MYDKTRRIKHSLLVLGAVFLFGCGTSIVLAQTSQNTLYVPLIGITSVPDPLSLPGGTGNVTYHYAVKNFLSETPLTDVRVVDDTCPTVAYVEGDDNGDALLDYSETWRYTCTIQLSTTTKSTATAMGSAQGITATHKAYATVIVGANYPPPLVSVINITKVAYPLSLPAGGGDITFTYKVSNPGDVPLGGVQVLDDKCDVLSGKLGDTNANNLLDTNEVWIFTCIAHLNKTTTNTVRVKAYANGLEANGEATITVQVETPSLPSAGTGSAAPATNIGQSGKIIGWGIVSVLLALLVLAYLFSGKNGAQKNQRKIHTLLIVLFAMLVTAGAIGAGLYLLARPIPKQVGPVNTALSDLAFGWKFPVTKFPSVGTNSGQLAYSDIRDPGGIPQGLPVRLKIPIIGVDSAVEDALITPDGRMDVPYGSVNVAWFALGPHPGDEGSAVIGGHFGIRNGVPFVFYNLDKLKINDKVYVVNDRGDTLSFVVRRIKSFDRNADATTVFTSDDGLAHLNLITCEGIWNRVNNSYPQRLVIFTDLETTGSAAAKAEATATALRRTLSLGSRGDDVAALQTALIQKGFLIMPRGVVKGYFGALTRTAVAKYQTSVSLPSTGVFDARTRLALFPAPPTVAVKPTLPSTAIIVPEPVPEPTLSLMQTLGRFGKSLFATPVDALVSSFLLLSILAVASFIIRSQVQKTRVAGGKRVKRKPNND